jgi:DNA-binding LytR/AlgR family response regulator
MDYKSFFETTESDIQEMTEEIFSASGNDEMIFALNEKKQIVMFKAPDILYVEEGKKKNYTVRTIDKSTICSFPSYDIFELLAKRSYFRFVNNSLMANMNRISTYDSNNNTIFFNKEIKINAVSASIKYIANNVLHAENKSKQTNFFGKLLQYLS